MKLKIFSLIFLIALAVCAAWPNENYHTCASVINRQETVVLLHGLCRTSRSMEKMGKALVAEGYRVINVDYPSRSATIDELTADVFKTLNSELDRQRQRLARSDSNDQREWQTADSVHFVTHSMGGILLRNYLENHEIKNLGRVVMLAPPSRGSEVTDKLGGIKLYQWINGPAGNQLGTGVGSHPLRLKAPAFELGIIAGDRTINPILSMLIPGPDDGKVSLARVKPAAYTDYLKLHVTHACTMRNRQVIKETIAFLKTGMFNKGERSCISRCLQSRLVFR